MTESNEQSLLEEQPVATKKPVKRKAASTKAKASTAKATKTPAKKVTKRKSTKTKSNDDQPELPVAKAITEVAAAEVAAPPVAPAEVKPARTKRTSTPAHAGVEEEWRPSSRTPAAAPAPPPVLPESTARPVDAPAVPEAAAPSFDSASDPSAPLARARPVYIPLHVAKQMEEQARLNGDPNPVVPIAVPASEAPAIVRQEAVRREPHHGREHHHREHSRERSRDFEPREPREPHAPREPQPPRELPPPTREEEMGEAEGIVEVSGKGFGFLRDPKRGFAQHPNDVFVTPELCRSYNLRDGQWVKGATRRGNRGAQLYQLSEINGDEPQLAATLPTFDELTVISPLERIVLETAPERHTTRIIDLMCPIGKGQRGLIVAPPRTGKTTLLQHIADAVVKNHPDIKLIILLVDERPEEVTEIKRTVPTAEIMASSNDSDVKSHTRIAQLAIERAKRLVESGKDVFVLLDSITRVGRAFNNAMGGGGRTMSGGIDSRALEIPRKLFAAARNTEEAGSLTIIATALIDTGSRMDELIFQEFKGTGNMELVLDRKISDQRIYPAMDIFQSGTRREELLIPADDLHKINVIRRGLAGHKPIEAIERLLFFLKKFPGNAQMLREIPG
jgi:transcription termination factor Rho